MGSNPTLSAILRRRLRMAHKMRMWYVYILSSKNDGKLYVGSTNHLQRRLEEHRQGRCESTRSRQPLELEAYVAVNSRAAP